jgi:hypothetical protein
MDKTLDIQQLPQMRSRLPLMILLAVVCVMIGSYLVLCRYIGQRVEFELRREVTAMNIPSVLVFSQPIVKRDWFSTTAYITASYNRKNSKPLVIKAKTHFQHLPIPFGKGWGKLLNSDTIVEFDEATRKDLERKFGLKNPKLMMRAALHFNQTTSFQMRGFPFQFKSKDQTVGMTKTARFDGTLDANGLIEDASLFIPEIALSDRRRSFAARGVRWMINTAQNSIDINASSVVKAESIEMGPSRNGYRKEKPVQMKNLFADLRVRNVNKKALMNTLGQDAANNALALSAKSAMVKPTEFLNLAKSSPNLSFEAKRIGLVTTDGTYEMSGAFRMGQLPQNTSVFAGMKFNLQLSVPVAGFERFFPDSSSRAHIRRLIRTGWLKKQNDKYISVVNYENRKLDINLAPVNPRSLQPFQ